MADFPLSILTPEKEFYSGPARMLVLPSTDGEIGIMAHHAPLVVTVIPGELRLCIGDAWQSVYVSAGFATVTPEAVDVLVQSALRPEEIDTERARRDEERAEMLLRQQSSLHDAAIAQDMIARSRARLQVSRHVLKK